MIYKLQHRLRSKLLNTETIEFVGDMDMLLNKVKVLSLDQEWKIFSAFDYVRITDKKLFKNASCFVVLDSEIERSELTAQMDKNIAYTSKEINVLRTDALRIYDLKEIPSTINN